MNPKLKKAASAIGSAARATFSFVASLFKGETTDPSHAEDEEVRNAENSIYNQMVYAFVSLRAGVNLDGIDSDMSYEEAGREISRARYLIKKHAPLLDDELVELATIAVDELKEYEEYQFYSEEYQPSNLYMPDAMDQFREFVSRGFED